MSHIAPSWRKNCGETKMARMHSRARGKSKSKRPLDKKQPSWVRYKPKEVEMLVVKMAKEGMSPSKIGLVLRDSYGVPDAKQVLKKTITKIFEALAKGDVNNDGTEDVVVILTQNLGGSETFYYVAVALNLESDYQGTDAILLGDRIAPQTRPSWPYGDSPAPGYCYSPGTPGPRTRPKRQPGKPWK